VAKPYIHAKSSVRKFGGCVNDYLPIHDFMDSSKAAIPDNRHRALTHNSWFLFVLEKVFGTTITNSAGRLVSVREIGEQHILEDFGMKFIPTPQDYLENMEIKDWMNNAAKDDVPNSHKKIAETVTVRTTNWRID
jgi:hypothetical protein